MNIPAKPFSKIFWADPVTHEHCEFLLDKNAAAIIGRSEENDIRIAEQHVSRHHAAIRFKDDGFIIEDLGSTNGTFVNDQRVTGPFPLADGDVIRLDVPVLYFTSIVGEPDATTAKSDMSRYRKKAKQGLIDPLSDRELDVLRLLADGLSNAEIAQELYLTVGTIKVHTRNIYGKLGVSNRTQAVVRAQELKIL